MTGVQTCALPIWGRRTTGGGGAGAAIPEEPLSISGEEDAPAGESTGASGGTVRVGEDRPGVIGVDGPGDEDSVTCEASGSGESAAGPAGPADNSAGSAGPGDSEAAGPGDLVTPSDPRAWGMHA